MKAVVKDVEKFMQAAGQETPDVPTITQTAQLYFGNPDDLDLGLNGPLIGGLVREEIDELADAWMRGDQVEILDGGLDAIWTIIAGLRALGFPIESGWLEVARSNLAKISADGTLQRRADGKILKPEGWTAPDLATVLAGHSMPKLVKNTDEVSA
ncbi:MAG: nucleoside triphosphate pyrophosphohydrolase family protein [Pseudomonadota bacterium]